MRIRAKCCVGLVLLLAAPAQAQIREAAVVEHAAVVLREVAAIPERGIPDALLQGAQGFAIVPGMIKAGFIIGGRYGRGVVVVRDAGTGGWSNPVFVTLAGGSVGWQAGAQATDLILVFRSRRSIDGFLQGRGKFTLGADASVAAGPVGRQLGAGTDVRLESEILTYSRSRGLFAGVSLDGSSLKLDWNACVAYYGQTLMPFEILSRPDLPVPPSTIHLKTVLSQLTGAPMVVPAPLPMSDPKPIPVPRADDNTQRTSVGNPRSVVLRSQPLQPTTAGTGMNPAGWKRSGAGGTLVSTPASTPVAAVPAPDRPRVLISTPTGSPNRP